MKEFLQFPKPLGLKCNMMPFVQGDEKSLPEEFQSYAEIVRDFWIEKGEIGFLTLDEAYVKAGKTQRGYNHAGVSRNVHIEVGTMYGCGWGSPAKESQNPTWGSPISTWGSPKKEPQNPTWGSPISTWGSQRLVTLEPTTKVLIANSISDTCRVWDVEEKRPTLDGDLSEYLSDYPEETGRLMKAGEVALISIFTPHECVSQKHEGFRQFFRIVGKGVNGREDYFTKNPVLGI